MKINEIFYSIQGEGEWTGLPNIFIRTTGCNLRCAYCDTKYAYYDGKELTIKEIIDLISKYPCNYVCLTGGEPLMQKGTIDLINTLQKKDYKLCLETNGSISIEKISNENNIMLSLDIKCPSSNMHKKNCLENIKHLGEKDQLKFVIKHEEDYDYAKKIIKSYKPKCTVFFQPVWNSDPNKLAEWLKRDNLNVRLGLQLHKLIWGDKRGV